MAEQTKKQQQKPTAKKQQQKPTPKKQQQKPTAKKQQQLLPKTEDHFRKFPFFKVSGIILLLCLIGLIIFLIVENKSELGLDSLLNNSSESFKSGNPSNAGVSSARNNADISSALPSSMPSALPNTMPDNDVNASANYAVTV